MAKSRVNIGDYLYSPKLPQINVVESWHIDVASDEFAEQIENAYKNLYYEGNRTVWEGKIAEKMRESQQSWRVGSYIYLNLVGDWISIEEKRENTGHLYRISEPPNRD